VTKIASVVARTASSLCLLLLLARAAPASALPIPTLYSTGFDADGQCLTAGADPHYTLLRVDWAGYWNGVVDSPPVVLANYAVFEPPIQAQVVQNTHPAWVPNDCASRWVSYEASWGGSMFWTGLYTYQTTFDLTGLDPASVRISGIWGSDDPGSVFLNLDDPTVFDPTHQVLAGGGFGVLPPFEISGASGLFRPGLNTLTFVVWDAGNSVTGLRFEVQSATAEPAARQVAIDVLPGTSSNVIDVGAQGELPVAILSEPGFDAAAVIPSTITVANARVVRRKDGSYKLSSEDVNGDGLLDLVVKVLTSDLGVDASTTRLVLNGETQDGLPVQGTDAVVVVP
jgi:hypothetical protein